MPISLQSLKSFPGNVVTIYIVFAEKVTLVVWKINERFVEFNVLSHFRSYPSGLEITGLECLIY